MSDLHCGRYLYELVFDTSSFVESSGVNKFNF